MMPSDPPVRQPNLIAFRLHLGNRCVSCEVLTFHPRLVDLLNAAHGHEMMVNNVSVQRIVAAKAETTEAEIGSIGTAAILWAAPVEAPGAVQVRDAYAHVRKRPFPVRVSMGQCELVGNIHLPEGSDLRDWLTATGPMFAVMTDAVVERIDTGSITAEAVVVFNRERADAILPAGPRTGEAKMVIGATEWQERGSDI